MSFHEINPPVPANSYDRVYANDPRVPRRTISASMQFEYPLTAEIITSQETFAVTDQLARAMTDAGLTGFGVSDIITTTIAAWVDDPTTIGEIPPMRCLDIWGIPLEHDLGLRAKDSELIVSERAYGLICTRNPSLYESSRDIDEHGNTIWGFPSGD